VVNDALVASPSAGLASVRLMPTVLLATCSELPDLDDDTRTLADALTARGVAARPAVWDDVGVDWAAADLVMVRSTWDYAKRRDEFLTWAERVDAATLLHNPPSVLRWTTDKTYLRDLAEAGIPTVPTAFLDADEPHPYLDLEHVVKPAVSAGSLDTTRVAPGDQARSRERVRAILESGRTVMVQPYVASVDEHGETALVYVDGRFSHALRKGAILAEGHGDADGLFVEEDMSVREPSAEEHDVAQRVLAAIPGEPPLYARVDLLPGPDGPVLLELELAEPSFFLDLVPEAAGTVADAVIARLT
jgi:glutathione synthase/RimK-type ligase-like ATP-grasp enzyme